MSNIKLPWQKKTMEEKKAEGPYGGYNTLAELQDSWADKELDRALATLERLNGEKKSLLEKWELFYAEPKREGVPTAADIKASYGIEGSHMPHGAAGSFSWGIPDVYLSEELSKRIKISPSYLEELREMIKRFYQGDFGFVTKDEYSHNGELRYLCGDNRWMIGRYKSLYGGVVLETLYDISILYFVHEDVSDICQSQFEKFCKKYGHDSSERNDWRINQLTYKK